MKKKNFKDISPKVDFIQLEHDIIKLWNEKKIFSKLVEKNS